MARRADGSSKMPNSPVVSVTARLAESVGEGFELGTQHRDVTIVVVSKAWRVPICVSCGWFGFEEVGVEGEVVVGGERR